MSWKIMLFRGLCYGVLMTGFYLLMRSNHDAREFFGGSIWAEFGLWTITGLVIAFFTERSKTYIERKNARWKARKESSRRE